jgi:hypothetical protein
MRVRTESRTISSDVESAQEAEQEVTGGEERSTRLGGYPGLTVR